MTSTISFKTLSKKAGVYVIDHVASGNTYVGSSANLWKRLREHRCLLDRGAHCNRPLQNAWSKHGADAFSLSIVEEVADRSLLLAREQHWMEAYSLVCRLFNVLPLARSSLGVKRSPETCEKLAAANRGRKLSAETIARRTASRDYTVSQATRDRHSAAMRGRPCAPETRAKIAAALRARAVT